MDRGYYAECSALKAQSNALELDANNIASVSTAGYSAAQLDKRRAGQLATAIQTAFQQHGSLPPKPAEVGGLAPTGQPENLPVGNTEEEEFQHLRGHVQQALYEEIASGDVAVRETPEGLVISLRGSVFRDWFSRDSRQLNARLRAPGESAARN